MDQDVPIVMCDGVKNNSDKISVLLQDAFDAIESKKKDKHGNNSPCLPSMKKSKEKEDITCNMPTFDSTSECIIIGEITNDNSKSQIVFLSAYAMHIISHQ